MASSSSAPTPPVPEVLNRNNYETWKSRMEAYLLAEDLWEVIETIREPAADSEDQIYKAWKWKNAKALYAIHNSCGPVMFQFISETKMAKLAWEVLQDVFTHRARVENSESFEPYIEFTEFVYKGEWEKAKECLKLKGLDLHRAVRAIDIKNYAESAIHVAAMKGHLTIVKELMLLMTHADLIRGNAKGNTALHLAVINGKLHIVNELVLLMREKVDNEGYTALHSSVFCENVDILKELVRSMRQTDLEIKNKEDHTALHLAVELGNVAMVKLLADLIGKVRGPDGDTALHMAVKLGARKCVEELVLSMKGEDLTIKNDQGYTALHLAVNMANMSILKEFMPKYKDRNLGSRTSSYHHFANIVLEGKWDDAKGYLAELDDPCDAITVVDPTYGDQRTTALKRAAIAGPVELVKEWISFLQERQDNLELKSTEDFKGFVQGIKLADVTDEEVVMKNAKYMVEQYDKMVTSILEVQDSGGYTALHHALYKKNVDTAKELAALMTEEGLEIQDNAGFTPLLIAVNKGLIDMVRVLVPKMKQTGLQIKTYKQGQNALQHAIRMKRIDIAKEVIPHMRKKALEETDREGYTALGLALKVCKDEEVMELAKCMGEYNPKVFGIKVPITNWIPARWVLGSRNWSLCRYLYRLTPIEFLMPQHEADGACLMIECIRAKEFDMVMDILRDCSKLDIIFAKSSGAGGLPPIMELARMSFTSPSETQLGFWRRFIYDRLRMEHADPSTCYSNNNITQEENNQDNRIDLEENNQENLIDLEENNQDNRIDLEENNQENVIDLEENNQDNRTDLSHSVRILYKKLVCRLSALLGIIQLREMKHIHIRSIDILRFISEMLEKETPTSEQLEVVMTAMIKAVEHGNVEFVTQILKAYPVIAKSRDVGDKNLFHHAVEWRQHTIYTLIYGVDEKERMDFGLYIVNYPRYILHLAGELSPLSRFNHIHGAALQMQLELQWFKEVESLVLPELREVPNLDGMMPRELFSKNHEALKKEAEDSMKGTATCCTVVGALIVTMMFAAAFTFPGGINGNTGYPMFLSKNLFLVFIVSDTLSLVFSTTSVITFLGILTSRYAEDDFLKNLPTKMMIGLSTLFISIVTMMIAFSSALIIMLHKQYSWAIIPSIFAACIPIASYVGFQFPLLIEIFWSTYGPGLFNKKLKKVKPWIKLRH